jgi:hypothetical protein
MKIKEIREVIDTARWVRNDLTGGTPAEFLRQNVGPRLQEEIAKLRALEIPERFTADIAARDLMIQRCTDTATRWQEAVEEEKQKELSRNPGICVAHKAQDCHDGCPHRERTQSDVAAFKPLPR